MEMTSMHIMTICVKTPISDPWVVFVDRFACEPLPTYVLTTVNSC